MGFRQLYIQSASKLSLCDNNLIIKKIDAERPLSFPLEDLDLIFVEDPNSSVTARLLCELKKYGASIVFCGPDYVPASVVAPINGHYLQSEMLDRQIKMLPSKKNKMWEIIIRQKIGNQMAVLENTVNDPAVYDRLKAYQAEVKFGDERNMEGQAAREYFRCLFGPDFIRFGNSPVSSALNYGYMVLTGAVIRSVAFNGLNDCLGIWHANMKNANNLSCDLVEPFRQVVDYFVYSNLAAVEIPLSSELRRGMVNLLNYNMLVDGRKFQVSYAISMLVNDYVEYMKTGDIKVVKMPQFYPNEKTDVL